MHKPYGLEVLGLLGLWTNLTGTAYPLLRIVSPGDEPREPNFPT